MNIQAAIAQVVAGQSLSRADMETVMRTVMQGKRLRLKSEAFWWVYV